MCLIWGLVWNQSCFRGFIGMWCSLVKKNLIVGSGRGSCRSGWIWAKGQVVLLGVKGRAM